jgi:ribosomal-protein-alanine N-acetyltransferase
MNFEIFETERLLLKKLTPADFVYIFENFNQDEIRRILGIANDTEYLIEENKYKNGYSTHDRSFVFFQLIDKSTNEIIGGAGFHNWYAKHKRAELGYALKSEEYKNKGLMTEALKFIIDFGFSTLELNRIEACIGPQNIPSLKLVSKYNFEKEGHLRQHYFSNDRMEDSIVFALLKEDYLQAKHNF